MSKPIFIVEPQRPEGSKWVPCEGHQALRFSIIRTEKFHRNGKLFQKRSIICSKPTFKLAREEANLRNRALEPITQYKLGKRITKDGL